MVRPPLRSSMLTSPIMIRSCMKSWRISGTCKSLAHEMAILLETKPIPVSIQLWRPITCPGKTCVLSAYYKRQLECVEDIRRLFCCGAMRSWSCLTIADKLKRGSRVWRGNSQVTQGSRTSIVQLWMITFPRGMLVLSCHRKRLQKRPENMVPTTLCYWQS